MSLVEKVELIVRVNMEELANQICGEYKAEVESVIKRPQQSTGQAVGSIHVEMLSDTHYRIGSDNDHLYFSEMGNGNKTIYPVRKKALKFTDGSLHGSASPYAGRHCNKKVADRYR